MLHTTQHYVKMCLNLLILEKSIPKAKRVLSKAVPLHAMEALGGRGGIAPTHSQPRH
jgi:hypothetical protein